ncbi:MAG: ParB/RepB/Spo0J family partition protein [Candidatus Aegiribacteria sp.]|nr:ParB/RepB/Spo0J family partition protein [Candidatus Aegiribacteria sp.]
MTKRKRKALGKGMEEIFPGIGDDDKSNPREVNIDLIDTNPFQPRKEWKKEEILSLASSIISQGILQPLVIRRTGVRYQLIAGERRLRAAHEAGLKKVPVVVREADDQQMLALALVENIQRQDLGPVEKAEAFQRLSSEFDLTQEEMGEIVGISRSSVANFQRLLDLPEKVLDILRTGQLSMGHGRALLGLSNESLILRMAVNAVKQGKSVRQIEERVRLLNSAERKVTNQASMMETAEIRKLQDSLQRILKTKVRIKGKEKTGKIEISYHNLDELDRILTIIKSGANV